MALVFKIVDSAAWRSAEAAGAFAGAPVDLKDGYVHLSARHQLRETAARHFRNREDLLLVAFEADDLGKELKWEPSRGGDLFPHLYGPLPTAAALWTRPLPLDEEGVPLIGDLP